MQTIPDYWPVADALRELFEQLQADGRNRLAELVGQGEITPAEAAALLRIGVQMHESQRRAVLVKVSDFFATEGDPAEMLH